MDEKSIHEKEIEKQTTFEEFMYKDDAVLEKEATNFLTKDLFIQPKVVTLWGLGKNKYGRHVIEIEVDSELGLLPINGMNRNTLINLFGSTVKNMQGKKIKIKATYREFDRLNPGYTLAIEKAE